MANATTPRPTRQPQPMALDAVLRQINDRRGLTTPNQSSTLSGPPNSTATTRPATSPAALSAAGCPLCAGLGYYTPDLPIGAPGYGEAIRCTRCNTGLADRCGLNAQEMALTAASIQGRNDMATLLRWLIADVTAHPAGWLTLWGNYGTAKTLTAQAIVAGIVRQHTPARFYHARRLEQGWFDDIHGDTCHARLYREIPVLAIDEIDKLNVANAWVRAGFQELLDTRYRSGLAGQTLTILICQVDPSTVMPGDINSRMHDGRFYRKWTGGANRHVVEKWGDRYIPGVLHIEGADARPMLRPAPPTARRQRQLFHPIAREGV